MSEKTRHLSLSMFLECLQLEYVNAFVRSKIYPKTKDKVYHKKLMEFKKSKVQDIALRNNLPCIFNDDNTKRNFEQQIIQERGFPKFYYRNEVDIIEFKEKDFRYYYEEGSEVRINVENSVKIGIIEKTDYDNEIVIVKLRGDSESKPFKFEFITRII